jgi:hypothetical protein
MGTISEESGLKTMQIVDSIEAFILQMSDFLSRHFDPSLTKEKELDTYLRKLIYLKFGRQLLQKNYFT